MFTIALKGGCLQAKLLFVWVAFPASLAATLQIRAFFEALGLVVREVVAVPKVEEVLDRFVLRGQKLRAITELEAQLALDAGVAMARRVQSECRS
jgi:hypothetical protein